MTATAKLTKAQLIERINACEREMGLRDTAIEALKQEVAALLVAQRPSRSRSHDFAATVPAAPRAARALPEHFARARELAMRTGSCVRVG